jgi:Spy/CpxP family protein refolding chaperone
MISDKNMKLKFFLLAAVIFLLGGITGGSLHALYQVRMEAKQKSPVTTQPNPDTNQTQAHPGRNPVKLSEIMKQELNLSDEQTQQVRAILEDSRKEFRRLMKDECPGFTALRKQTNERIRKILTPEQQQEFDKQLAKRETMFKSKEGREK